MRRNYLALPFLAAKLVYRRGKLKKARIGEITPTRASSLQKREKCFKISMSLWQRNADVRGASTPVMRPEVFLALPGHGDFIQFSPKLYYMSYG